MEQQIRDLLAKGLTQRAIAQRLGRSQGWVSMVVNGRVTRPGIGQGFNRTTHGHASGYSHSPEYKSWSCMLSRCRNSKSPNFKHYGGRGITVCDRWLSFEHFLADMGERPDGHTLDRIDPDGNYEPRNCRWATPLVQRQNQRRTEITCEMMN